MIKLPKKITRVIELELGQDYTVIKEIYIHSIFKELCVHLINIRKGQSKSTIILRYFGDNSYSFIARNYNDVEVKEEMSNQVMKLW